MKIKQSEPAINRKQVFLAGMISLGVLAGCSSNMPQDIGYTPTNATMKEPGDNTGVVVINDQSKGEGRFTNVTLTHPLNSDLVNKGNAIYSLKCSACHKLTDERVVGPGWKGLTDSRKPEWIMNFITNTDEMLDKDATAQALLKLCVAKMPNPNLTDDEARQVLEFMRKNDGKD